MALINTGAELFVFDNGAGYSGYNYVNVDNPNQTIGLTNEANSAISAILNGDYIPVSAMEVEGETLTALSGYKIAGDSVSAEYALTAEHAYTANYSTTAKYDIEGNVINEYYATNNDITGLMDESKLKIINNHYITGYNGYIFSAKGGGGTTYLPGNCIDITDDYISVTGVQMPVSAGNNIQIIDDVINVTGVATTSDLRGKQDSLTNAQLSAISSVSSMYNMITAMSAMLSAQWKLSAGNGIKITNDTATKTSVIGVV